MTDLPITEGRRAGSFALVRRLFQNHIRRNLWPIAAALVAMAISALSTAALAYMVKVVLDKIADGSATEQHKTKLVTGKFFMERMLPETALHLTRIQTGADTTMALAAEAF